MELSEKAKEARRAYQRKWKTENPEKVKRAQYAKWENKAKEVHGRFYEPPRNGEPLSRQARELRKEYYKEYRRTHPEDIKRATVRYWERKASNV